MIRYEDVKNQTTEEYFGGNQFSINVFNKKYKLHNDETYVQAIKRVCDYIASAEETEELKKYWSERWFDEIYNDWWHPAGSIMQGAASGKKISLFNCFSADTSFITDKGVKTFSNFFDGETTNVLNNYGAFKPAVVKKFGKQKLVELLVSRNGMEKVIHCTTDHVWRVIDKKGSIINKRTFELNPGEHLPYIKRKWQPVNGSRYFCPIGFIHGLVFGDGCYKAESNTCEIRLCDDSREFVKFFNNFNWSISHTEDQIIISYLPNYMKEFPDFSKVNEEYILGFLIGWFAADGTVDVDGRSELSNASKFNLELIKSAIESLGIYTGEIRTIREKSPFDNSDKPLYGLYFLKDSLFSSFFVKSNHKKNYRLYATSVKNEKRKCNWKVISVTDTDKIEDVWCAVVPNDENFTLAGGLNTHNCTTISLGHNRDDEEWDSLEGIIRNTGYTIAKTAAYRQGLGVEYSRLRPLGTSVLNSANESTGPIHWMKFHDSIGYYVGQMGRIPAMLFSLSCKHPDVMDFIKIKSDRKVIQNANISVQCFDDFYKAVEKDGDWELLFEIPEVKKGDKVYVDVNTKMEDAKYDKEAKKWYYVARKDRPYEKISKIVKAKEILELIAQNMCAHAEPGIQNIDVARKYSNSDYVYDPEDEYDSRIVSTNACSEQYLSKDSCCVLSSLNAGKFSANIQLLIEELKKISYSMNRFLDNVNEKELRDGTYVTPNQKLAIEKLRRTGAGFTNIASWLFKNNLEYGSKEGNEAVEKFAYIYNYFLYKSSIELGKEKGNFGLFDRKKYEKSPFIKRMMEDGMFPGLEFRTMRNVTCSSIAPTGTLSLMFRESIFSYGIEPAFYVYFWKRTRMSGAYEYYFCVPNVVKEYFKLHGIEIPMEGESIKDTWDGKYGRPIAEFIEENMKNLHIKFKKSTEVNPLDKLDLMARVMKWVDSSISVTYMLPEDSNWKDVYNFILEAHKREVKSIAAYPDRKMYGVVSFIPFMELAVKLTREGIKIKAEDNFSKHEVVELEKICNKQIASVGKIQKTDSPKRPKHLKCDLHHVKISKKLDKVRVFDYVVFVGLMDDDDPYEVFVMENGTLDKKYKEGRIFKKSRGVYCVELEDGTIIQDITKDSTEAEDVLTRLVSCALRHGADIQFVVQQLEKSKGDLSAFSKAISRVLKKYIKDGTKVHGVHCSVCGSDNVVRQEGCQTCQSCGNSKCN